MPADRGGPPHGGPPSSADLVAACAALQVAWLADVARATDGAVWSADDRGTWVWTPRPCREAVLLFPAPGPGRPEVVAHGLRRAAALGARTVGCWAASPDDALARELAAHGFEEGWRPHWMALDLAPGAREAPLPAGVEIAEAREVPEWDAHGQALLTIPAARAFVARADGALAGFAWLHPGADGSSAAGLYDLVTFEPHRRRGISRALTLAAARAAARAGRRSLVLNATQDGAALYAALGFASLGEGRTWWRHGTPVQDARASRPRPRAPRRGPR